MNDEDINKERECPFAHGLASKKLIVRLVRTPQEAMRDYKEWLKTRGVNEQDDGNAEFRR